MINDLVAAKLAAHLGNTLLSPAGPLTRVSGMVQTVEQIKNGKTVRFAVSVEAESDFCSAGEHQTYLMPDGKEGVLLYFEDNGIERVGKKWLSKLRLVGWANILRLQSTAPTTEIKSVLLLLIEKELNRARLPSDSIVASIELDKVSLPATGSNLFASYTYRETHSQYLLHPYFSFALDLQLTVILKNDCYPLSLAALPAGLCE